MNQALLYFTFFISLAVQNKLHASQAHVETKNTAIQAEIDAHHKKMAERLIYAPFESAGYYHVQDALKFGIDVNAQDENGNTVLINTAKQVKLDILKLLIESRPDLDVNLASHNGETPIEYALRGLYQNLNGDKKNVNLAIIELLVASNAIYPDLGNIHGLHSLHNFGDKNWYCKDALWPQDEWYHAMFYTEAKLAYEAGRKICEQRKQKQTSYEQEVAHQLQQHIPVKNLNSIIADYSKMNILQFVHFEKQEKNENNLLKAKELTDQIKELRKQQSKKQ